MGWGSPIGSSRFIRRRSGKSLSGLLAGSALVKSGGGPDRASVICVLRRSCVYYAQKEICVKRRIAENKKPARGGLVIVGRGSVAADVPDDMHAAVRSRVKRYSFGVPDLV